MTKIVTFPTDHIAPAEVLTGPQPLADVPAAPTRSAAEEARTLVQNGTVASLSTLSEDGHPWGSMVTYAVLPDGAPAILVSTLAAHGRNLVRDQRASIVVAEAAVDGRDPLDSGRVTLAGRMEEPKDDAERAAARAAVEANSPAAALYGTFGDFTLWVLRVEQVRWVGGYGRMDSATPAAYTAAAPDPVAPSAAYAVSHLNADHADALLDMAQVLAGFPDATAATCSRADRYGLDLTLTTPRGTAYTRIGFAEPCTEPGGLRAATVELAKRARA
jgi:putative heme iron utilization protein